MRFTLVDKGCGESLGVVDSSSIQRMMLTPVYKGGSESLDGVEGLR